jgi:hypothetical protein
VDYEPGWRNKAKFSNGRSHLGGALGKVTNDDRCDWRDDHVGIADRRQMTAPVGCW